MTDLTLEKRVENLEKMYLILQDDVDKKLEMLRENNNLFATEIKELGGFQEDDDFEALDLSPIKEICNAFEKVYGKEEKNCKYHFKIEEHGSCYILDKIVFNERCSSIATIWFNDMFPDSNMLSKSKAYEIITTLKKQLEEESKGFKFCCNRYGCCDKYGQEEVE